MYTLDQIIDFLQSELATKRVGTDANLENNSGCTGDDFAELMERYALVFNVDMEQYCWYFHHESEGFSIGRFIYPVRSPHIPVTARVLLQFANIGRWECDYPYYSFPTVP